MPSTQLKPMTWEWLGSFFLGEGCISVRQQNYNRKGNTAWGVNLALYQNDIEILDEISLFLYEHGIRSLYLKKNRDGHVLQISARSDVILVLTKMIPYLRTAKRELAIEAKAYLVEIEKLTERYGMHFRKLGIDAPAPPKQVRQRTRGGS